MKVNPSVSVIICVFNAGAYLRPAIESVMSQTFGDIEVLVIDDGSTDGCIEKCFETGFDPRIRLIRQTNHGKPSSLNLAIEQARGEFYAVMDADDLMHPERIARQVECLRTNADLAAVFCGY